MKILFICHANLCRSFMAQELLKKQMPKAEVFSRGLYAHPSATVPAKVLRFLSNHGITPSTHHPTQLAPSDLETADLILCMQIDHLEKLCDRFSQHIDKMWLLSEYAFGKEQSIEDPIDLEGKAFDKQATQLVQAVCAAAKRLQNTAY